MFTLGVAGLFRSRQQISDLLRTPFAFSALWQFIETRQLLSGCHARTIDSSVALAIYLFIDNEFNEVDFK